MIATRTPCPCGPASRVGGFPNHHPDGGCDGEAFDGLLCRPCADVVWAVLDSPANLTGRIDAPRRSSATPAPPDPERDRREAEAMAYISEYRGTFGLILDLRADRRMGTKYMHLSDRQIDAVLASRDREAQWARERAAKQEARREPSPAQGAGLAPQPSTGAPVDGPVTEDGMYLDPDGTIWKVQRAIANGSGNLYAKRLDPADRSFVYTPGAIRRLRASWRMTLDQAKQYGSLYGFCVRCGRDLTDEYSIANGIGKVCAGKM